MFVIAAGNLGDGVTLYGPFSNVEDATEYAERTMDCDWWVMQVLEPLKH